MTTYDFIFSDKPKHRFLRHFAFWAGFSIHLFIADLYTPDVAEVFHSRLFLRSLLNLVFFLPVAIYSTYIILHILLPAYLFKKYVLFSSGLVLLFTANFIICYYLGVLFSSILSRPPFGEDMDSSTSWEFAKSSGLWLVVVAGGFAASIKITKNLYQNEQRTHDLIRQRIDKELQLLKTELHPRFLFKSLRTIHGHVQSQSLQSTDLLLRLSDLLSYIVYESDDESVPLKKELNALNEYIRMENQGFADSFESTITVLGDAANYRITPLLLFPYVEHSFEYFESIHPVLGSLNINISVGGTFLLVELVLMHHTDKEMAPHKPKLEELIRRLDRISPLKSPIKRKWASDGLRITIGFALNYFEKETIAEMSPQLP